MFTRKAKRNYRIAVFAAVIVCLCALIAALLWPETPSEEEFEGMNPDYSTSVETGGNDLPGQQSTTPQDGSNPLQPSAPDLSEPAGEEILPENEENSMNQTETSYYLVKKAGDVIAVFFCDAEGNMVQLENTAILYGMLGEEDQKLFDIGIRVNSQEELSVLLQDFEG